MHLILIVLLSVFLASCETNAPAGEKPTTSPVPVSTSSPESPRQESPETIADHLQIPWSLAFLPNGDLLVTERPGTLLRITGTDHKRFPIQGVRHRGEGGLLGLTLHPDFDENGWIYLYLTTSTKQGVTNRVERYRFADDQLTERTDILTGIPGSIYHDGGRLAFGPDGMLYITTGDAGNEQAAQETQSLAGKILRMNDDGSIPEDNPFKNAVYSYGHRNPQGLAWDDQGRLWSTEHGRSGAASGYDELNLIEKGKNYGWPVMQGSETNEGMIAPMLHSGARDTWAPASAAYHNGSIFFGGLRGKALYEAVLPKAPDEMPVLKTHRKGTYGRIRDVRVGPDGLVYLTTSNTDGRGSAKTDDDRIITLDPATLR